MYYQILHNKPHYANIAYVIHTGTNKRKAKRLFKNYLERGMIQLWTLGNSKEASKLLMEKHNA